MEEEQIDFDLELDAIDDGFLKPPFNKTWKKTFDGVKNVFNSSLDKKACEDAMNEINDIIEILVDANTYEDVVLKTAILYCFVRRGFSLDVFSDKISNPVKEGVLILTEKYNSLKKYLDNIFYSNLKYLNKIKLAEYLQILREAKITKNINLKTKTVTEINLILANYDGHINKYLINLIIETINN